MLRQLNVSSRQDATRCAGAASSQRIANRGRRLQRQRMFETIVSAPRRACPSRGRLATAVTYQSSLGASDCGTPCASRLGEAGCSSPASSLCANVVVRRRRRAVESAHSRASRLLPLAWSLRRQRASLPLSRRAADESPSRCAIRAGINRPRWPAVLRRGEHPCDSRERPLAHAVAGTTRPCAHRRSTPRSPTKSNRVCGGRQLNLVRRGAAYWDGSR